LEISSNYALVANIEFGSDVDTKISLGVSCGQVNRHIGVIVIHSIYMLVVVLNEMHHFAFVDIEFH